MSELVGEYPSVQQARCWAQEVISSQLQGEEMLRDQLLQEYCSGGDGALLGVTLAFFQAAVHVDQPPTAHHRFYFAITMLGDLVERVAGAGSITSGELAAELVALECGPERGPSDREIIRAAQTALVSHMRVRKGEKPLGVQTGLDAQSLSDLVGGVLVLTTHVCHSYRDRVSDIELIKFLLPRVVEILEMGASSCQMSVQEYTQVLWMGLLLGDCPEA